jgi:hypothetical protein
MLTIAPSSKAEKPEGCHDMGTPVEVALLVPHLLKYFLRLNIHFMQIEISEVTFEIYFPNSLRLYSVIIDVIDLKLALFVSEGMN